MIKLFLSWLWVWDLVVVLTCLWLAALPDQRLELEQHAGPRRLSPDSHYSRHLWDEGSLAVCGDVLLLFLLAYRGPLELLHKLSSLVEHFQSISNTTFILRKWPFQNKSLFRLSFWSCVQGWAKDVVRGSWLCCRAPGVSHEEIGSWAVWVTARPPSPAGDHHESQHADEQRGSGNLLTVIF